MKAISINLTEKDIARFWSYVDKRGENECWNWTGDTNYGYGKFYAGGKVNQHNFRSHRVAWVLANGRQIRAGFVVAHAPVICHNRLCCNPKHLLETTQKENKRHQDVDGTTARAERHGSVTHPEAFRRGDTHPSHLHPERVLRGSKHPNSKLTESDVVEIRNLRASGMRTVEIAERKRVSKPTIISILARTTWKHVR